MALTKVSRGLLSTSIEDNGNATAITIDSSENVGIGTSSPNTGSGTNLSISSDVTTRLLLENTATNGKEWGIYSGSSGVLGFYDYSSSSEAMRIDSSGRVSVGTKAWITADANVGYFGGNSGQSNHISFYDSLNLCRIYTNGSERLRIDSSGNLLVGATSNAIGNTGFKINPVGFARIERSGTGAQGHITFTNGNGDVGSITTSGSSTSYNTSSDQRLKENIADADDAGSKIDAIQVRKYDWKVDGSHQDYGMIAQELQTVAPEAVSGDADSEEMMGVDYSKLVPMLIKEIQSLRNRVAQLEE